LPLTNRLYWAVMPQSWAPSRRTPPAEQYMSPLSSEDLHLIQMQAVQRVLDSRSFWTHFILPHPSSLPEPSLHRRSS
jgi:hypothetical protein